MIARQIVVVDIETNGLNFERHRAVEVAWWNLTTDARGRFIPPHSVSDVLAAAELQALRINRYIDRIAGHGQDVNGHELGRLHGQFLGYDQDDIDEGGFPAEIAHTLAGSNPAFDAQFLAKLFAAADGPDTDPEPWHHRLWDLSAYAAGVLGLDELPGLARVCELLDVEGPDHTAEGDVTATGRCFLQLQQIVAKRAES
ncbi:hypothetical protein [Pseudonocardia sp. D17]|uniref:hypothetical protein n=1 Tax=Pseudonocardia sp. D17 TaxID=882661 RepID=UPI002B3EF1FB|nr:hypothetical protein PSD17_55100 [Pseudonocardia sp. D17]